MKKSYLDGPKVMFVLAFATSGTAAMAGPAPVASALVREAAPLPGAPAGHNVTSINNSAVNHVGGYAFTVNSSDGATTLSHVWGNASGGAGTVMRTEGTFGSLVQTAFESFFGISNSGQSSYSATGTGGPVGGFDSVWLDDAPYAVEGNPVPSLPGQFWVFASRPGVTADGRAYWVGGFSSTQGGATQNRGLFIDASATVILMGGQMVPNLPFTLTTGNPVAFDYRISALATHYIAEVQMTSGSTTNDTAVVIDGQGLMLAGSLVREGTAVPAAIGGLAGENWGLFGLAGINEAGDYFFVNNTSAATTADEIIVVNGQVAYREGQTIDGRVVTGAVSYAYMNEQGDLAFVWQIVTEAGNIEALFLNGEIVLSETDPVDLNGDGTVEPNSLLSDFTGITALTIGDRDAQGMVSLYFTADTDINGTPSTTDDIEGGFCMKVPVITIPPCPADIAPAGGNGVVNVDDLLLVINSWGICMAPPAPCPADIAPAGGNGMVNVDDLLLVINSWGPCAPVMPSR